MRYLTLFLLIFCINACSSQETSADRTFNGRALPENVCRVVNGGTERPFTGEYWNHKEKGQYVCVACDSPLFSSRHKYQSGSGWPSYYDVLNEGNVKKIDDNSLGMRRIEIRCANCDAHLGHLFNDGPKPTGYRYCVNSASLNFIPSKNE